MYRILVTKAGLPSGTYTFYKRAVTITDQISGDVTTSWEIFETDDIEVLKVEYLKLLEKYPTTQVFPIDNLATELDVTITDETNEQT